MTLAIDDRFWWYYYLRSLYLTSYWDYKRTIWMTLVIDDLCYLLMIAWNIIKDLCIQQVIEAMILQQVIEVMIELNYLTINEDQINVFYK